MDRRPRRLRDDAAALRAAERASHILAEAARSLDPVFMLFRTALEERLAWARAGMTASSLQAALARRAVADRDMARASALSLEACISAYMERVLGIAGKGVEDPASRSAAQEELNALAKKRRLPADIDYLDLKDAGTASCISASRHASAPRHIWASQKTWRS